MRLFTLSLFNKTLSSLIRIFVYFILIIINYPFYGDGGNEQLDGLYGALIVRQSPVKELHQNLYDFDDPAHLILINEWPQLNFQSTTTPLLINGRGPVQVCILLVALYLI